MINFFKKLFTVLAEDGKSLVVWLIHESGLSDYPGLVESLNEVLANPSKANFGKFLFQVFWAGASGHRALKVLTKLLERL